MPESRNDEPNAPARPLSIKVALEGKPDQPIEVTAYAFDGHGKLLASAPARDGEAKLALSPAQAKTARIFLAALPEGSGEVTLETLARAQAYEPARRYDLGRHAHDVLPIPEFHWRWWIWCFCRASGRVVRPVEINGVTYEKPVCNARVHICEVDPILWIIPRLPDDVILRWRDEIYRIPRPIPEPDPPYRINPGVVESAPISRTAVPAPAASLRAVPAATVPSTLQSITARDLVEELPLAARAALQSNVAETVRRALIDHVAILRPYICRWPWLWPLLCLATERDVVTTDEQGRFESVISYRCAGDHPDLYFWVEYCLGGTWTTVYRPSVCCHTYWDYRCGCPVTIQVTDPRVPWCDDRPDLPGNQIAVITIGNQVSMTEIRRASLDPLLAPLEGLTSDGRPFAGSLEPAVWFGDGLIPSGITHYRWSYRRLGSAPDSEWTALDAPVVRHYAEIQADDTLTFRAFPLGPDPAFVGRNLFKIRPLAPPLHAGAVSSSWAPERDGRANTASGYFLSRALSVDPLVSAGKYELKLELFKSDGTLANLTDEGVLLKVPTLPAPFPLEGDVPTELVAHVPAQAGDMEDRVIRDGADKIVAFRLVLHVDNNRCEAEIYDVTVGSAVSGPCGFIAYPSPAAEAILSFKARHPNDFATFSFTVAKGSCGVVAAASASGRVAGPKVGPYTRNAASIYTSSNVPPLLPPPTPIPVSDLLNGGPCGTHCTKAAFSETLEVRALAVDGWGGPGGLNASAVPVAFALEPA
jgi:hypothetical protein